MDRTKRAALQQKIAAQKPAWQDLPAWWFSNRDIPMPDRERTGDEISADRFRLIAAVCGKAQGKRVILFGSSSLFASFPEADPIEIGAAVTIDADFFVKPDDFATRSELAETFGEDNEYQLAHGFYADFVEGNSRPFLRRNHRIRTAPLANISRL